MKSMLKTALCTAIALIGLSGAAEAQVRISQVFPGAGCGTAGCSAYNNDYVELYNAGASAVDLSTWSIQYQAAATTGAFAASGRTNLTGSIQPGGYYLIQLAGNANGVLPIPTPDATGTTAMSGTAGKIALVQSQTSITGCTDANVVDLIGYGTANCSETANAPAPGSNANALFRADNGCTDANNNSTDFTAAAAAPRNSTNTHSCGATTGACCVGETCTVEIPGNCTGTFQGLGSACTPNPCVPQIGACCVNGFCVGDLTESACLSNGTGSSWGGLGTTCDTFSCPVPTGACCNGLVCTSTTQAECTGTWTVNVACTPTNPCDPAQACCFGNGACIVRPSVECATLGGTPNGDGTTCAVGMNTCPPAGQGACCVGAACSLVVDPIVCLNQGGQFRGYNSACGPTSCFVAGGNVIATYDFDLNVVGSPATNLSFAATPDRSATNGAFPGSVFDVFGVTDRTVNADVADDSTLGADTFGILRSTQTGKVFGVEDLLNPDNASGTGTATFTFNVSGFQNLSLSVDCAAFGNFEAFGTGAGSVADIYRFSVSIDGGAVTDVINSNIYEGLSPTYTLENGTTNTTTPDPCAMNGALILNQFATIAVPIPGSGSTLSLTFFASNDGGSEVVLFDNIVIRGTPVGGATGACCQGTTCSVVAQTACTGANSSYKGDGTVCNVPGNATTPCCKADFNQSGTVTVQDIFDFLAAYFTANPQADINGAGGVTVQDIFDYLAAYFAGCA